MIKLPSGAKLSSSKGSYQIREFLGRGGFAFAYLATTPKGELVVLKTSDIAGGGRYVQRFVNVTSERSPDRISPDERPAEAIFFCKGGARISFLDDREIDEMIRSEGELLMHAHHENLVSVRDVIEYEGRPVLVMGYVRGRTLREKIRTHEGVLVNWLLTIVRALQKLGESGKLAYHGDLKPENIIIGPSGRVTLIDPAMRNSNRCIATTTPHYNPLLLTSQKADVMGIGVMLYEIMTGVLPFGEVPWKYAGKELSGEIDDLERKYFLSFPPPHQLNRNIPARLERIIYGCLMAADYGLPELEHDIVEYLQRPY